MLRRGVRAPPGPTPLIIPPLVNPQITFGSHHCDCIWIRASGASSHATPASAPTRENPGLHAGPEERARPVCLVWKRPARSDENWRKDWYPMHARENPAMSEGTCPRVPDLDEILLQPKPGGLRCSFQTARRAMGAREAQGKRKADAQHRLAIRATLLVHLRVGTCSKQQ